MLAKNWRLILVPLRSETFEQMKRDQKDGILDVPEECYNEGLEIPIVISAEFRKQTKFKRSAHASISSLSDMETPLVKRKKMIINHVKTLLFPIENIAEIDQIDFNLKIEQIND